MVYFCLQNPSNGAFSARVGGLIPTGTHTCFHRVFSWPVKPPWRNLFFLSFLNVQMSIQTRHLLCDIIYYIFMGCNFVPITHLVLVSFLYKIFCGFQPQALRLTFESKGLPKVYTSWHDGTKTPLTTDRLTDWIALAPEAIKVIWKLSLIFSATYQSTLISNSPLSASAWHARDGWCNHWKNKKRNMINADASIQGSGEFSLYLLQFWHDIFRSDALIQLLS